MKRIYRNPALVLMLIIFLSAILRFVGTSPGYPPIHTDEGITHSQGIAMILERSLDPKNGYGLPYNYPILVPLINALFYLFLFIPVYTFWYLVFHFNDINAIINNNDFSQIKGIFEHNILGIGRINVVFWGRYVTALFGTGVVFLTYRVSKLLFNSQAVGLMSAFLVAVNYRQVLNSHIGIPDIYNSFFLLLSLFWIIKLWHLPSRQNYILSGLGIALYFSTKFQFFSLPSLLLALFYLSLSQKNIVKKVKFFVKPQIGLILFSIIIPVLILNIFHILNWRETLEQVSYTALKYRPARMEIDFYSLSYLYQIGVGPITSWLVIGGIFLGLLTRFRQTLFILSTAGPFLVVMIYLTGGGYYTRNFVTITPLLLILAAFGVRYLFYILRKVSTLLSVVFIVIVFLLITNESLKNSILVPIEYIKPWNIKVVQGWIGNHLKENSLILTHQSFPLMSSKIKIIRVDKPDDYFLKEMQDQKIDWAVIDIGRVNTPFLWWMTQTSNTSFRFWIKPNNILQNQLVTKMMLELKNYVVFEALNPWQAPDNNFLVVKIPPKVFFDNGELVYEEHFDSWGKWLAVNDSYGSLRNFSWDESVGYEKKGSLRILGINGGVYSQRFVSPQVYLNGGEMYKINGKLRSSTKLTRENRDGVLGIDFFAIDGKLIGSALSSRNYNSEDWAEKEIVVKVPNETKVGKLFFQVGGSENINFWLDDVKIWKTKNQLSEENNLSYIKSKFDPDNHLFLNSNGGM